MADTLGLVLRPKYRLRSPLRSQIVAFSSIPSFMITNYSSSAPGIEFTCCFALLIYIMHSMLRERERTLPHEKWRKSLLIGRKSSDILMNMEQRFSAFLNSPFNESVHLKDERMMKNCEISKRVWYLLLGLWNLFLRTPFATFSFMLLGFFSLFYSLPWETIAVSRKKEFGYARKSRSWRLGFFFSTFNVINW